MTDERGSSPLALAIREVPGIAIASIGFGCALLAIEGDRLSTIRTVNISGDYHAVASLVSFLLLIMLALAYRKLDAPTHVPAAIVIGAGALMSLPCSSSCSKAYGRTTPSYPPSRASYSGLERASSCFSG